MGFPAETSHSPTQLSIHPTRTYIRAARQTAKARQKPTPGNQSRWRRDSRAGEESRAQKERLYTAEN